MDTARTMVDAIWAGVMSRHPGVNLILAHAGGVLPVLAPRLLDLAPLEWCPIRRRDHIRRNPGTAGPPLLRHSDRGHRQRAEALLEMVKPSHIVFGTDYPAAGPSVIDSALAALGTTNFSREELLAVASNALTVFPSLRTRLRR